MKQTQVDHYGAHLAPNGLWFLLQNDEQNERGLFNVKSNLVVKPHRNRAVTHSIRLGVRELPDSLDAALGAIEKDKLGKLLLPNPNNAGKIVFVEEEGSEWRESLYNSMQLTTPTLLPIRAEWLMTLGEARGEYRLTNVQPLVILGVTPRWMAREGSQIASLFRNGTRPLILVGSNDVILPPEVQERISGKILKKLGRMSATDLKQIGSHYLQNWFKTNDRR